MHESDRPVDRGWPPLAEAALACAGMCLFALFAHHSLPLVSLSAIGALATAFAIYHCFRFESFPFTILGVRPLSRKAAAFVGLGIIIGVGLGAIYRTRCGWPPFPAALKWFAGPAALIGATEEVLYRGYIQGRLRRLGIVGGVVCAALCHAAYKCSLFALPPAAIEIDYGFLATWTILGGLLFGALRELSESVIPPLAAHACFDIVVYGELSRAPWWIWS